MMSRIYSLNGSMVLVQKSLLVWSFGKQRCEDNIKINVGDISYNVNCIKLAQDSLRCVECLVFVTKDIPNPSQVTGIIKIPQVLFFFLLAKISNFCMCFLICSIKCNSKPLWTSVSIQKSEYNYYVIE
jgi:hypothetical protein